MADDQMFQEVLEAIENGQHARARDLLNRLLRVDKNNADYWLYMSSVVDSPKERKICLDNALRIDPQNSTAIRGISLLGTAPPETNITPIKPVRTRKFKIPDVLSKTGDAVQQEKRVAMPIGRLIGLAALSLIGFLLIYIGIFGNPFSDGRLAYILPSNEDLQPLPTEPPTSTAFSPDNLATPVFGGATPLVFFLETAYTPTPRVVNTPHPESNAFNTGMNAYDQGDYETAVDSFLAHISDHPADADVRFYLGLAYYQLGEYQEADAAFIYATNYDPEFGIAYLWEVITKMTYLEKPVIGEKINTAVMKAPEYFYTHLVRGEYFLRNLNMELALGDLENALELAPDNANVQLFAANYYLANGLYEDALPSAQTSYRLDSTIIETYFALGRSYFENDLFKESITPLKTFLQYEPENAEAWLFLGKAEQETGDHNAALVAFDQVEKLKQGLLKVFYYKGLSLFELGYLEEAAFQFDRAFLFFPNWFEAKLYHGVGIMEKGEIGEGYFEINASQAYAKTEEQLAMLYYWRGHSLERLNEPVKASQDWNRLLALDPQYVPQAWAQTARQAIQGIYFTSTPVSTQAPATTPSP